MTEFPSPILEIIFEFKHEGPLSPLQHYSHHHYNISLQVYYFDLDIHSDKSQFLLNQVNNGNAISV